MDRSRITTDDFLPLRPVEFRILVSLAAGERHGYGIIQEIEASGEFGVPDIGTMYRALARLTESGLIEPSSRRASGPAEERRNYYRITAVGRRVARAEAAQLQALMRAARSGGLLPKPAK